MLYARNDKSQIEDGHKTREKYVPEELRKCPRSRMTGMKTYKIHCGTDDVNHMVVKVYNPDNFYLHNELRVSTHVCEFRNTARLICHFSYDDNDDTLNNLITYIKKQIHVDVYGPSHLFVYEYAIYGNVGDFLIKNQDTHIIRSFILQIACVMMQFAAVYQVYYGCIHEGNILIYGIESKTVEYSIEGEIIAIDSYGFIPKTIDYGRSNIRNGNIFYDKMWFSIVMTLGVIHPYIQNDFLKQTVFDISTKDVSFPSLREYYDYLDNALRNYA